MKTAVRYYSRGGNTKKLADAIAQAIGTEALDLSAPLEEYVDILFLGSSIYAGKPDQAVKEYITANAEKIGSIANFGSAAARKSTYAGVKEAADANGIKMIEDQFFCNGSFLFMHKGRPNEEDLKAVKEFASKILAQYNEE
ncbi:MAG: flavodoxin [Lachnospiraceae bacterium]|nr:flavodoxin [Lachnospiraceae bacterium]MBR6349904.1 flavodoxin [Lachnospiraceae bacterium]